VTFKRESRGVRERRLIKESADRLAEEHRVLGLRPRTGDACPVCRVYHRYKTEGQPDTLCEGCNHNLAVGKH